MVQTAAGTRRVVRLNLNKELLRRIVIFLRQIDTDNSFCSSSSISSIGSNCSRIDSIRVCISVLYELCTTTELLLYIVAGVSPRASC